MNLKYKLRLDPNFEPMILKVQELENETKNNPNAVPLAICVERQNGYRYRYDMKVLKKSEEELELVERIIKSILWVVGGYKVYIGGPKEITEEIKKIFSLGGKRDFDVDFMSRVYDKPFEVITTEVSMVPTSVESSIPAGGHLDGCRIGFDAGGSDRKVSAVVDGNVIYSEEVVWLPKVNEDPEYHYQGILDSFKRAASKMPRVDAIGVSSAGIYINNEVRVASLFIKIYRNKSKFT